MPVIVPPHQNPQDDGPSDLDSNGEDSSEDSEPLISDEDNQSEIEEFKEEDFPKYYIEKDGKLYSSSDAPYPLPVDANELERFNLMHDMLYRLLGAHFLGPVPEVLAPTPGGRRRRVLDVCNGNGKWVMDMAELFPEVLFRGIDIVPIATRYPLSNVLFEIQDARKRFRWNDESFDLIHARDLSMAICDWPKLVNECARLLRPGGMFISCEWTHFPAFETSYNLDVNTNAPASVQFFHAIHHVLHGRHIWPVSSQMSSYLSQSRRFTDITEERRVVPIGEWPQDERMSQMGSEQKMIFHRFTNSVMPVLVASGMENLRAAELIGDYLRELDNVGGLVCIYHITFCRKV